MSKQRKDQVPYQLKDDTDKFITECMGNFKANTGGKIARCDIVDALIRKGGAVWDSVKKPKKNKKQV